MKIINQNNGDLVLWIYTQKINEKLITKKEELMINYFSEKRKEEFINSRSYLRISLAEIFNLDPLDIPIDAKPGKAPKLTNNNGFLSLSHCKDAYLIAWSKKRIGIDIENKDRKVSLNLIKKYLPSNELTKIYDNDELNKRFLEYWLIKESLIKWQNGNFFIDFNKWKLDRDNSIAVHQYLEFKVKTKLTEFRNWKIGLASDLI